MSLNGILSRWFYEWAARDKSYEELVQKLHKNEAATYSRMMNANEISFNRARAAHVIGIERWSAQRLRVLLGEPLVIDEYDGYAPSDQLSMAELAKEFKQTRAATIALVRELQNKGVDLSCTVIHNDVGDLSAGGWLFYIENHTGRETLALIPRLFNKTKHAVES
jgi:hypothetical protein